ncbi:hypothetical protein ABN448_10040 [Delftia acidovorans]
MAKNQATTPEQKPNQINEKCRKSSTGQHVAHVRGAHDGLD